MSRAVEPHGAVWQEVADLGQVRAALRSCKSCQAISNAVAASPSPPQAPICPICCDSQLDEQELVDPFCGCGYQLCSFCLNRIQTEGDSICEIPPRVQLRACLFF